MVIRKKRKRKRRKRMVMKMLLTCQVPRQRFEVVVVMEGTSETSNMAFQVVLLNSAGICTFRTFFIASKQFWRSFKRWSKPRQEPPTSRTRSNGARDLSRCWYIAETKTNSRCSPWQILAMAKQHKSQGEMTFTLSVMCLFPQVNFSAFHSTYEVATPLCSARTLERLRASEESQQHQQGLQPSGLDNNSGVNTSTHQDSIQGEFLLRSVSRSGSAANFRCFLPSIPDQ